MQTFAVDPACLSLDPGIPLGPGSDEVCPAHLLALRRARAWLLLASMTGVQQQQDFNNLKAVNIQGKLVLLKKYDG